MIKYNLKSHEQKAIMCEFCKTIIHLITVGTRE
jgi:hypothetical protein